MHKIIIIFLLSVLYSYAFYSIPCAVNAQTFGASPDQVLVLFNEEYKIDTQGSSPGQDSLEVAAYYQKMYTDPVTGKKPYLLGLKCLHGKKHLNNWFIQEESHDNKDGVQFVGSSKGPGVEDWARDSRKVEIIIAPDNEAINWESVEFFVQSSGGSRQKITDYHVSGIPIRKNRNFLYPNIEPKKGRCYRFDAHKLFPGTVEVFALVKNQAGKIVKELKVTYWDKDDFKPSLYGQDGVLDEKVFQEDVAIPVKTFLESRENRLPDGKWLKDHILYIVVAHGLPFSCKSVFGIERGVTDNPSNYGVLGSLEQRLQTLYYKWETSFIPPVISRYMIGGPGSKDGIRNYKITSAMSYPMTGKNWNPYMHPDTYSFLARNKKHPDFINLISFEKDRMQKGVKFFAYGSSRIDGSGPLEAKRIIDYSLYASKYLRPEMVNGNKQKNLKILLKETDDQNLWGREEISHLGFPVISKSNPQGLPFLKQPIKIKDVFVKKKNEQDYAGYFPGGMDRTVVSGNGWNMGRSAAIWKQIDQGVTVSACGGPAYGEGPHITNATFWDNRILLRYLFRGRDLGECFLRSTYYVNWATSLLGDPLYHPDLSQTVVDTEAPTIKSRAEITIDIAPSMEKYSGVMTVPVQTNRKTPEVCLLKVLYAKKGEDVWEETHNTVYSVRPYVVLRNLYPDTEYNCRPLLTDPYGNTTDLSKQFGLIDFRTESLPSSDNYSKTARKRGKGWEIDCIGMPGIYEKGTIEVEFTAGKQGLFPSVESNGIRVKAVKWADKKQVNVSYAIGGPKKKKMLVSPLEEGEHAKLIIRWRKFPLTREILLKAEDNSEFTLLADVRTPWQKIKLDLGIELHQKDGVKIISGKLINDALPASESACGLVVVPVDRSIWTASNGKGASLK